MEALIIINLILTIGLLGLICFHMFVQHKKLSAAPKKDKEPVATISKEDLAFNMGTYINKLKESDVADDSVSKATPYAPAQKKNEEIKNSADFIKSLADSDVISVSEGAKKDLYAASAQKKMSQTEKGFKFNDFLAELKEEKDADITKKKK